MLTVKPLVDRSEIGLCCSGVETVAADGIAHGLKEGGDRRSSTREGEFAFQPVCDFDDRGQSMFTSNATQLVDFMGQTGNAQLRQACSKSIDALP